MLNPGGQRPGRDRGRIVGAEIATHLIVEVHAAVYRRFCMNASLIWLTTDAA